MLTNLKRFLLPSIVFVAVLFAVFMLFGMFRPMRFSSTVAGVRLSSEMLQGVLAAGIAALGAWLSSLQQTGYVRQLLRSMGLAMEWSVDEQTEILERLRLLTPTYVKKPEETK